MPVYEYECKGCDNIFEVQQKIADKSLSNCPRCHAPVKKLMSMSSFQLKGGGWYADGYSNGSNSSKKPDPAPCQSEKGCATCPAATSD